MLTHANLLSNSWINGFGDVSTTGSLSEIFRYHVYEFTTTLRLQAHYLVYSDYIL